MPGDLEEHVFQRRLVHPQVYGPQAVPGKRGRHVHQDRAVASDGGLPAVLADGRYRGDRGKPGHVLAAGVKAHGDVPRVLGDQARGRIDGDDPAWLP